MPLYEFECNECRYQFESLVSKAPSSRAEIRRTATSYFKVDVLPTGWPLRCPMCKSTLLTKITSVPGRPVIR